jgi:phage-related protein (TIGR01555 family)
MKKTSVKAAQRAVLAEERQAQRAQEKLYSGTDRGRTVDSFVNFAQKMGIGADNAMSTARYGFNPITRNRMQLEWMHRGAWLAGVAVDVVADDMTRAGADFACEMDPVDSHEIETLIGELGVWDTFGDAIRWGRLYGGAVAVMLVEGQDMATPLRPETVGKDQFKGLLTLDRWMLEPDLSDLVTELGPDLGLPKYYRVMENAPALRFQKIHYTRLAIRHVGVALPYQQALSENLWGLSVIERLYDRMAMFDSASTGAGQLVYKSWLRTLKVKDLRSVVAAGNKALEGLTAYADMMRRYQNIEGSRSSTVMTNSMCRSTARSAASRRS